MPEVAEVHLMTDAIESICQNQKLIDFQILSGRYSKKPPENIAEFRQALPLLFKSINTKGKFCWLKLESESESSTNADHSTWYIGITFGMSGSFKYTKTKHSHIQLTLDNDSIFYYEDIRNFGTWTFTQDWNKINKKLLILGPDILKDNLADSDIISRFRNYNYKNICQAIMEQKIFSGAGNYLKSESLYRAQIYPYFQVKDISDPKLIELYKCVSNLAMEAYKCRGASLYTYSGTQNEKGTFQNLLSVYGRKKDNYDNPIIRANDTPDKRTTYWVREKQDPNYSPDLSVSTPVINAKNNIDQE